MNDTALPEDGTMQLRLERVRLDGGTQSRARLDPHYACELAELLAGGADLPPVVIYFDGSHYWLASGFHRYHAHVQAGRSHIEALVRKGTVRDARLLSCASNATHGLRRTGEDKRHAIGLMLADPDWSAWSNRKIADHCGVSEFLVRTVRTEECDKNAPGSEGTDGQEQGESAPGSAEPEEPAEEEGGEALPGDDVVDPPEDLDEPADLEAARGKGERAARKFLRAARELARLEQRPRGEVRAELLRRAAAGA